MRFTWKTTGPASFTTASHRPNGETHGRGGMPQKYPSMSQGSMFSQGRRVFRAASYTGWDGQQKRGPCLNGKGNFRGGSIRGRRGHGCTQTQPLVDEYNYLAKTRLIAAEGSSQRTARLKAIAIGKSSQGRQGRALAFKSYDPNVVRQKRQRSRSGGSVAPRKKGAVSNPNGAGGCC